VETLQRSNAENVGGCMTATGTTNFGKAVALATSTPFGIGNSRFHYANTEQEVDSVYLGAWPRRVFASIGLFDEELVRDQDDEFNYRLRKLNGKIILNPKIQSVYSVRSTPRALFKQYYQYGLWKIRVLQKHLKQMSLRQFIPPLFILSLLLSMILMLFIHWGIWVFLIILGSYLLANLVASLSLSKKGGTPFYLVSFAFSIIHFGYGLGFLAGLVKFSTRWKDRMGKVSELREVK
jgi:GT2 family glycosyltransferase